MFGDNRDMKEEKCKVIENLNVNGNYYLIQLETNSIALHSKPGNFVMVAISKTHDPLLKRPFGIFKSSPPYIWLYYQVVGRGTDLMSQLKPGDEVVVVGPLGNCFPPLQHKKILLVAGGRGFAPIHYACEYYSGPALHNHLFLIYGARSAADLNLVDRIEDFNLDEYFLYTDDGSKYQKGFVTSGIESIIEKAGIDVTISCGPHNMFQALQKKLAPCPTDDYVSLEAIMGCGIGACYSCAVKTAKGDYLKVCSDGPVFKMEDLAWGK